MHEPRSTASASEAGASSAVRIVRFTLVLVLLATGLGLLALSFVPFEDIRPRLDAASVDGDAGIDAARWETLVLVLRCVGVLAIAGAAVVVLGRSVLDRTLATVVDPLAASARQLRDSAASTLLGEDRGHLVALGSILAVSIGVRGAYLGAPMRYDEATTYNNFVAEPVYVALANYATPNNHVFHTLLAKASILVFGDAPWAVRLPALIAGAALVIAIYVLGRRLYGRTAGLLAAALVAGSSTLVEYSTNARGYTIVALLTVLMFLAASRLAETDDIAAWATIALLATIGFWTIPVMLYPFGSVVAWLVLARGVRGALRAGRFVRHLVVTCVATGIATTLLYLPVLVASGPGALVRNEFVRAQSLTAFLSDVPDGVRATWASWHRDLPAVVWVALAVAFLLGVALAHRIGRRTPAPALGVLLFAPVVVALQRVVPYGRVWLFALVLCLVTAAGAAALAIDRLPRRSLAAPVAVLAVLVLVTTMMLTSGTVRESRETGALLDGESVARYLEPRLAPGDSVVAPGSDTILEYYLRDSGLDVSRMLYAPPLDGRVILVVNELEGQTANELMAFRGLRGEPVLLRRWPSASVYVLRGTQAPGM